MSMAKLSDLVNVNINRDEIKIQDAKIPIVFTMLAFPFLEEAYGKSYVEFERDLHRIFTQNKGEIRMGKEELHLMQALIYAMVRAGGTECTPGELMSAIPPNDLPGIFQKAMVVFMRQKFQDADMELLTDKKKV